MRIVVLLKQVPDTWGERTLNLTTGLVDREPGRGVTDEIDERALEVALTLKERDGADVVVLTMGPADAVEMLRRGLAVGADSAVHILDDSLAGADLLRTSEVLAAALQRLGFDLVLAGNASTDGGGGVLPALLAERLGLPAVTVLQSLDVADRRVRGERVTDTGTATVSADLPAVASVTEAAAEPRFPNFRGLIRARKRPVEVWGLADLGLSAPDLAPRSVIGTVVRRPARSVGQKIVDDGTAGARLAGYLVDNRLV